MSASMVLPVVFKTPIRGLYLCEQDVFTPGVPGEFWGGILCAAAINPKVLRHLGKRKDP